MKFEALRPFEYEILIPCLFYYLYTILFQITGKPIESISNVICFHYGYIGDNYIEFRVSDIQRLFKILVMLVYITDLIMFDCFVHFRERHKTIDPITGILG